MRRLRSMLHFQGISNVEVRRMLVKMQCGYEHTLGVDLKHPSRGLDFKCGKGSRAFEGGLFGL